MNRIEQVFQRQQNILSIYYTAGFPSLNDTLVIMKTLQDAGVDMIELGMPYSDPIADGPVIQQSSATAIANGMTINVLFEQLKDMRQEISIPVILMGYLNPILQYGFENCCADAASVGIDGLIIPDLPGPEYEKTYAAIIRKHDLCFSFLVTPETSEERVKKLDALSSGFLYAVSSSSVTGSDKNMLSVNNYLQRLRSYQLNNPLVVGFGIKTKTDLENVYANADGGIIGTAFIEALAGKMDVETISSFIKNIKG